VISRACLALSWLACSTPEPCPTAAELTIGRPDGATRIAYQIISARCEADAWAPVIRRCLRTAPTDSEQQRCLGLLAPGQDERLTDDLERAHEDLTVIAKRAALLGFTRDLAVFDVGVLRVSECASYRRAIVGALERAERCSTIDEARFVELEHKVLAQMHELTALTEVDAVRAGCRDRAARLAADPRFGC
jgi:hypothetical protein